MADRRLADLLKEVLVYRSNDKDKTIQAVADKLGWKYQRVWASTHGRATPSVEVIRAAYEVTGDPDLARELTPDGRRFAPEIAVDAKLKHPEAEATDVTIAMSMLINKMREYLADGEIDADEKRDLITSYDHAEREFFESRAAAMQLINGGAVAV